MKELVQKVKQAVKDFVSSRTRVAVLLAVIAALVGAMLLLPPPSSVDQSVQTVTSDAGAALTAEADASVVLDLPVPDAQEDADLLDATNHECIEPSEER